MKIKERLEEADHWERGLFLNHGEVQQVLDLLNSLEQWARTREADSERGSAED